MKIRLFRDAGSLFSFVPCVDTETHATNHELIIVLYFYAHLHSIRQENYTTFTPLVFILVLISSAATVRSGTRCTIAAVATCAAVLTCFATLIVNQSHYAPEFHIYRKTATVVTLP